MAPQAMVMNRMGKIGGAPTGAALIAGATTVGLPTAMPT